MSEVAAAEKLPTDVETAWLNIQNLDDKTKLKISIEVNGGEFEKVIFNRDPAIDQNNIGESHNITWLVKNSYDLAIAQSEVSELTRQNKILRDALEYVLEDHDCEHIDCIEFNKQRAREALKSCGGGTENV